MSKLECYKVGSRIKVAFEGEITDISEREFEIRINGSNGGANLFVEADIAAPSFTIEKLPDPIKVGDEVYASNYVGSRRVLWIDEDVAWLKGLGLRYVVPMSQLRRIDQ